MRIFETTSVYSFDDQEWTEIYKINNEPVDADTYFEEMEYEVDGDEDDEFDEDECDCENCEYCSECDEKPDDETLEEIKLIEHLAHIFEESECTCGACLRNTLDEAFNLGRQIGFNDCKEVFRSVVDHLD